MRARLLVAFYRQISLRMVPNMCGNSKLLFADGRTLLDRKNFERQAIFIGKSHAIPGLPHKQKFYLTSDVDEQQTKITYNVTMTAVNTDTRELVA